CLVLALAVAGADVDALAAAEGLLADAEVAANPTAKALAMYAYAWVYSDHWSASVYDLNLQPLTFVQECGNMYTESVIVLSQSRLAMLNGDLVDAFDHLLVVLRRYRDSGSSMLMYGPLALLAALLDQLGRHEPAATIMGFAAMPIS